MAAIARAIEQLTAFLTEQTERARNGGGHQPVEEDIYHGLDKFLKRDPPKFEGGYNPDGAYEWIRELERIFETLVCADPRKFAFASYLLSGEARTWWTGVRGRITPADGAITWEILKNAFLEKNFPANARGRKEMEFLELKKGMMLVGEYAAKFEELCRFHPHYSAAADETSKYVKFEYGLRPDIRTAVGHDQIQNFATLVEKCRIFEENEKSRKEYLKGQGVSKAPKKKDERRKPYFRPPEQGRNQFGSRTGGFGFHNRTSGFNPNNPFCVRC
ncbi:uncharacterized protein LOC130736393 [Lotus japonicus]|uniref:uncharacterized protein LOC130736393 n=1 Tax=Lotus japonicus TaxID=34305 RepID=UPI002587EB7E|nr:uncharacterized protein LOC130736393 [Lotus japonicus]